MPGKLPDRCRTMCGRYTLNLMRKRRSTEFAYPTARQINDALFFTTGVVVASVPSHLR
jgi:hypothetical protein